MENVNGSEAGISIVTKFDPDTKENFWVDDHPVTSGSKIQYLITAEQLRDFATKIIDITRPCLTEGVVYDEEDLDTLLKELTDNE